jgi:hypothetical protein
MTDSATTDDKLNRWLGHPVAYVLTLVILLTAFGWTFVSNPERGAPTRDPAFYTWRTDALLHEEPRALLDVTGPLGLSSGGYRVSPPVIGAFLSNVAGMAPRSAVATIMVGLPVVTAALLAGFATRRRRDPLLWHAVAFGSAGMLLTPPFVGYLDNVLSLFFVVGALWFIEPARATWRGRIGFGFLLLTAALTHPTTVAIFDLTLGAMALAYFIFVGGTFRERLKATWNRDAWVLGIAVAVDIVLYVVWKGGIWGKSISLSESALLFPYDSDFFLARMDQWVDAMRPVLNGPLFAIGIVGLLATGRRWVDDELARVSIVWLAPLVGSFGFLAGLAYPYYRFFNTTLAWVLLVGIGAYFAMRFFIATARRGGAYRLSLLGVAAVVFILGTNFTVGFDLSTWQDPSRGWLPAHKREALDNLRAHIDANTDPDQAIVFVLDNEPEPTLAQIWGWTQVWSNTSRYALPEGRVEHGYVYQGSLENFLAGEPTVTGDAAYDEMALASFEDAQAGIERADREPLVIVYEEFNPAGANFEIAAGDAPVVSTDTEVWVVSEEGQITRWVGGETRDLEVPVLKTLNLRTQSPWDHTPRALLGVIALLLPGFLALRWFLPDAGLAESAGMAVALSLAAVVLLGMAALAVTRSPFGAGLAWACVAIAVAASAVLLFFRRTPAATVA